MKVPVWETRSLSERKRDAAESMPGPIVPAPGEVLAAEMRDLAQKVALEGFLKTVLWRTQDKPGRAVTADFMLRELRPWLEAEVRTRFLSSPLAHRILPPLVRDSTVQYLARWVEQALITQPMIAWA